MNRISVLISVYSKEKPAYLQQSLDSIFAQTMLPDEVVLVEDGPLTEPLLEVIASFAQQHQELHIVKLPTNVGLGLALNEGLKHCHNNLVARMDSDDLMKPERLAKQAAYLEQHPEIAVVGSWTEEFRDSIHESCTIRKVPETHEQLVAFSRRRNPMNHPTVMFRKQAVEAADSYHHCLLFEDYDLWIRMMRQGARFYNLQESLLYFRVSNDFFKRRGGWAYIRQEIRFQHSLHRKGHIGFRVMLQNIIMRTILRSIPNKWRQKSYLFLLRKQ
ncbi:MAG: glycosyltransferase [Prevotella ruminicola]|jgi:glycosyltransferase involved in cell wall biosynthesis|uniref:Glycosyltransferase n=1 Tax=Xylanibacter ruminicola TaxID=839 RepID=A0A9D5P8F4_XYLRU|nr:glycosyltransferase [Xylanibacter ruminicola]